MDAIFSFLTEFGEINGLLILGIIFMFLWLRSLNSHIHRQHREQLQDRQREIDRLAEDNRAYRDRYLTLLDKKTQQEENTS